MSVKQARVDLKKQNKKRSRPQKVKLQKLSPICEGAMPEILRIEIDQIFKEFLDNPEQTEYIFPPDLNNLQRKYIHAKALGMNIISRSYGAEPKRRLHLKKKSQQPENQSFVIKPCSVAYTFLNKFMALPKAGQSYIPPHQRMQRRDKVIGRLVNGIPTVPAQTHATREIIRVREALPIHDQKDFIIHTIRNNQITIISSETGSGKTTQVAQYIMQNMTERNSPCKIICTQPRRISTVSAAERVAFERNDTLGVSVGYHIRLEQKYGISTNLVYCTTGVFLRNLMLGCEALTSITHIIIDEVHERDKLSDFLLICLKQRLPQFPNLKLVLMSATMNTAKFLEYFGKGEILSIPGRLFPIDVVFLEEILVLTKYMSPKMREVMKNEKKKVTTEHVAEDVAISVLQDENLELDEALDDYLNFSDNYDYKVHYEEATMQLGMYYLSEGLSVDYQHSRTGKTALMIAAYLGDKEFIGRLCNMGGNMDLYCNLGKTAFDYACDNPDTLQLLEYIKRKRDSDAKNPNSDDREAEDLLHLYDKTTSEDNIDFNLIVTLVCFIHHSNQEGSILIFLPGYDDIMLCNDKISNSQMAPGTYKTFFLHSSMNVRDQHEVFRHLKGIRKIILSTNIAETSITIDDVVFVIDTGKAKEKCYDAYNKVSSLQTRWISQACAKQRTGRAGRTKPGMCFRLFSKQRFANMEEERMPEILRVSLEELCLHTKVIAPEGMNIHEFLTMAPDAPSANSIKVAIENLQFLGALGKEEELTLLGEYLAQLAIEPQLGKMLIFAVIFRCLDPVLTLVASMSHKDPFQLPPQANLKNKAGEKRRELLNGVMSDHLLYLMVFIKWQEETYNNTVNQFCRNYFISNPTMNSILETRSQLLGQLRAAGFVHQSNSLEEYNRHSASWALVKAIICTGVYPNIAYPLHQNLATRSEKKVNVHNGSACARKLISTWLIYDEKIKQRHNLLIRGVTAVTTITVALMCGIDCIQPAPNSILIDDWLEFEFPDPGFLVLRSAAEALLKRVLSNPSYRYSKNDSQLLLNFRSILDIEEINVGVTIPTNVGEKPQFFFPLHQGARCRRARQKPNPLRGGLAQSVGSARQNRQWAGTKAVSPHFSGPRVPNGQKTTSTELTDSLRTLKVSDGARLLNGIGNGRDPAAFSNWGGGVVTENKFGDYSDRKIFMLIKPRQKKSVDIAQQTNKWVFAPQTEKKILHYNSKGKIVYLLFTVNQSHAFQGMAEFLNFYVEPSGKPTSTITWVYKLELEFSKVRQLRNPYNENRPIYEGLDGQVIQQTVAEELVRIYNEVMQVTGGNFGFPCTSQGCSTSAR